MMKFPIDAPKQRVIKTLKLLGFQSVREAEHIAMLCNAAPEYRWLKDTADTSQSSDDQGINASPYLHAVGNSASGLPECI
jgi:hypothetical protein